ncbi:MAG: TonB-dependent receptor, partial [Allosphingosinicella sp.]
AGYATNLYDTPEAPMPASIFPGGNLENPFPIGRNRLMSAFASDTIGLWNDRILATAGLRLQAIDVKSYAYADGSLASEYDEDAVTPVFGLVVKPVEGLSFYANRIEGLAQGPSAPVDPNLVNPGEVFAPFTSVQYEAGGKVDLGRFNASLGWFRTDLPSAYARPVDPANPGGPLVFGVFGEQRNSGFELVVDGAPAEGLRIIAGGSLLVAELRRTTGGLNEGNRAAGVPEYLLNANAEWDLPFLPATTLTGRVVHTGPQYADAANSLELDSWTRLDLGLRYVAVVGDNPLTLRFNVDNVTNARYWASAFDAFGAALLQGGPRTFRLSASIEL